MTDTDGQRVSGPRHDADDASLDVILGAVDELIQRLQSRSRRAVGGLLITRVVDGLVVLELTDLIENDLPAQLGRQVVKK